MLDQGTVQATSVNSFKTVLSIVRNEKMDVFMDNMFVYPYGCKKTWCGPSRWITR
jgi:hypothetical protein